MLCKDWHKFSTTLFRCVCSYIYMNAFENVWNSSLKAFSPQSTFVYLICRITFCIHGPNARLFHFDVFELCFICWFFHNFLLSGFFFFILSTKIFSSLLCFLGSIEIFRGYGGVCMCLLDRYGKKSWSVLYFYSAHTYPRNIILNVSIGFGFASWIWDWETTENVCLKVLRELGCGW